MSLRGYSTEELLEELRHREQNPTWFIKDLVEEGYDLDNDDFREATDWMDDPINTRRREE